MKDFYFLTMIDVINLHAKLIRDFGGLNGIRDQGLLESAVFQAQVVLFNEYVCVDIYEMAAAYCFHIIKNHAFVDGNKRTGIAAALLFLELNGVDIVTDIESLYTLAIGVASSVRSKKDIACQFREWHIAKNNHTLIS